MMMMMMLLLLMRRRRKKRRRRRRQKKKIREKRKKDTREEKMTSNALRGKGRRGESVRCVNGSHGETPLLKRWLFCDAHVSASLNSFVRTYTNLRAGYFPFSQLKKKKTEVV